MKFISGQLMEHTTMVFCYNFSKKFQKITKFNILIIAFKMKFR